MFVCSYWLVKFIHFFNLTNGPKFGEYYNKTELLFPISTKTIDFVGTGLDKLESFRHSSHQNKTSSNILDGNSGENVKDNVGGDNKDLYLGIAGTVIGGMELRFINDSKQVLKYGQRIDGKVRSAETLTRANRISSTSTAKYLGYAGKALRIYNAYDAGTKLIKDPSNPANWVKFGASTGMLLMKTNPLTFAANVGYTVLDLGGYIDKWFGD